MHGALRAGAFAVADAGGARARAVVRPLARTRAVATTVPVAAGIVRSADGRILLAERTARQISAGYWEIPGGKIDPGETPAQAAARELAEEVGITAHVLRPWVAYEHAFRHKRIQLHFFCVDAWTGTPAGREGQRLAWVDPAQPHVEPVLPSNDRLLTALGLSAQCLLTPGGDIALARAFLASLPDALNAGVRFIGVREPYFTPDQRVAFARRIVELGRPFRAQVTVSGSVLQARRAGALGLYATIADLRRSSGRPPVRVVAAACRDRADAEQAAALGADVAVIEDAFDMSEHELTRLASRIGMPVYAVRRREPGASVPRTSGAGILALRVSPHADSEPFSAAG